MKRYITAFVIFAVLFFSTISIVKAECETIEGDTVETELKFEFDDDAKPGDHLTIKNFMGEFTVTITGKDANGNFTYDYSGDLKGNFVNGKTEAGYDVLKNTTPTQYYKGEGTNADPGKEAFPDKNNVNGNNVNGSGTLNKGDTIMSKNLEILKEAYNKGVPKNEALAKLNLQKGHPDLKRYADFYDKGPKAMDKQIQNDKARAGTIIPVKATMVKAIVCKENPDIDLCEDFATWPDPQPMTCHNGTVTPAAGNCYKSTREDGPISSYTTQYPIYDPNYIRRQDVCDQSLNRQKTYKTVSTMRDTAGNIKANQKNMQDKLPSIVSQYNNELWTSKFQREDRFWNPFQEGVISPGLPVYAKDSVHYTVMIDSWKDKDYDINNFLKESINHLKNAERVNDTVVRKYNGSNINVYDKAPNPMVTHRYLDQTVWKDLQSSNIRCEQTYELMVEPRYQIVKHDRYQKVQQRDVKGREKVETYDCNPHTCTKTRKTGTQHWSEWRQEYVDDYETYETTCWDTCCRTAPDNHHQEWPDGETQHSSPAGEIEPIYAPRVKWRYRIGVGNEYHASAKRLTDKAKLTPVPNSKDTQKMKSGYGFKYSGDKWKIVTDYDEPQFKNESDVIRPNKNVALKLTGNIKSQTEYFDPNVQYDSAKNAPERSSSKDSRYIEERIKASKIKSDFNKNAISKFVSKIKDDSSLLRIRPYTKDSSVNGEKIIYRGKAINMETQFESQSDPNKYYHAYWVTKGEPNLIPAYKQAPLHYVHLDYPSGTMYDIYSINRTYIRNGFTIDAYNTGSIKIVGNMWEDSFSRPNFKK